MQKISFVIPCYHSAQTVGNVVRDIVDTVLVRSEFQYEIILVNDNPPDDTWRVICEMCRNNPNIHGICFTKNFGQHAALMAGYRKVTGDIVVSLDDDGQKKTLEEIGAKYHVSRERVRQIENRAICKLKKMCRNNANEQGLKNYLDTDK